MGNIGGSIDPTGPRIDHVGDDTPKVVIAQWVIALICWVISCAMYASHHMQLMQAPRSELRRHYLTIIAFPLVICTFSCVCLFSVRPAFLWELIIKIYESTTLMSFALVIMALMGYEADAVARTMTEKGAPTRWKATFPFTFWLRPCVAPTHMSSFWVSFTYYLVVQFVYIIPFMGLIQLWMQIDHWNHSNGPPVISIISTLIAMQGLFMLYRATYPVIHHYEPTFKFATIKLIVLVSIIQQRIIEAIVDGTDASVGAYDTHALASMWDVFVLAVECPLFALLMFKAFPVAELMKHHGETAVVSPKEMVDMEAPQAREFEGGKPKRESEESS